VQAPDRLVIWEGQYGDFINGAQVMLDQFVTSARAKWGQTPSLVLLLPHGYEGQGPEHSSARPERFLGAAADINLRLANCTTAAQYFHLLRRQALLLTTDPLPLVVLTPKSLLRHPLVASAPREFAEGAWRPVIDDVEAQARAREVTRVVFCSSNASPIGQRRSAASSSSTRSRARRSRRCWPATRTPPTSCGCRKSR
jgi:2-oxoglutarate dehydrogenase E1 component